MSLLAAAALEERHRQGPAVELVWTGPETDSLQLRRTEQAILEVLNSAQKRIILVSYAVYRIPNIGEALKRAAGRGVRIVVIVETPHKAESRQEYDTLRALGADVTRCSTVYCWPFEARKRDANGRHGILHVKCAVGDGRWLFLSSANLTEQAFTINMELGVLVTGGSLPSQVEAYFTSLITAGVLVLA